MASTPKSQLEDPNNPGAQATASSGAPQVQAPTLGSTASFGGTAGNTGAGGLGQQGAQAQGQSPGGGTQAGTGFMNIDRYLGANQNAGSALQGSAADTRGRENASFGASTGAATAAIDAGTPRFDGAAIINGLATDTSKHSSVFHQFEGEAGSSGGGWTEDVVTAPDDRSAAIASAQAALGSTYSGPTSYAYGVGNTDNAQTLKGMGNAQTAGAALAAKQGPLAAYNPGLSAIDQAIYGSSGQLGAVQGVAADNKSMFDAQNKTATDINNKAANASSDVADNVAMLGTRLRNMGTQGNNTPGTLNAIGQVLGVSNFGAAPPPQIRNVPAVAPQPTPPPAASAPSGPSHNLSGDDLTVYNQYIAMGYSKEQAEQQAVSGILADVTGENSGNDTSQIVEQLRKRGIEDSEIADQLRKMGMDPKKAGL